MESCTGATERRISMKVKMVRGYYGLRNGKISELKDINSPDFDVDDMEAERIIGLGIAKAVSDDMEETEEYMVTGHLTEEQLREMPYSRLKQLCKELGVSAVGKQDELIERLVAVEVQTDERDSEDEELPPMLDPAEPEE